MTVTLTAPGKGEEFPAGPVRFRILEDGVGVDKRFGVVESYLPPGWSGPPQHIHRAHDETFYVVTGTILFTSGTVARQTSWQGPLLAGLTWQGV